MTVNESLESLHKCCLVIRECVSGRDPHCFWDVNVSGCKPLPNAAMYDNQM